MAHDLGVGELLADEFDEGDEGGFLIGVERVLGVVQSVHTPFVGDADGFVVIAQHMGALLVELTILPAFAGGGNIIMVAAGLPALCLVHEFELLGSQVSAGTGGCAVDDDVLYFLWIECFHF